MLFEKFVKTYFEDFVYKKNTALIKVNVLESYFTSSRQLVQARTICCYMMSYGWLVSIGRQYMTTLNKISKVNSTYK